MGQSGHNRVLVSNRGDGNWNTLNRIAADGSIHFPHGALPADPPSDDESLSNSFEFTGWESKSNWILQANLDSGTSCTIAVFAMRPTGIEELVVAATTMNSANPSWTHGGVDAEEIVGPVQYFRFLMASASGSPRVDCFVIGWNEGDMIT